MFRFAILGCHLSGSGIIAQGIFCEQGSASHKYFPHKNCHINITKSFLAPTGAQETQMYVHSFVFWMKELRRQIREKESTQTLSYCWSLKYFILLICKNRNFGDWQLLYQRREGVTREEFIFVVVKCNVCNAECKSYMDWCPTPGSWHSGERYCKSSAFHSRSIILSIIWLILHMTLRYYNSIDYWFSKMQ